MIPWAFFLGKSCETCLANVKKSAVSCKIFRRPKWTRRTIASSWSVAGSMFGKSWDLKSLNTDYSHPQKDRKIIHRWWFEIWGSCFPIWGIAYWNLEKVTHFIRPSFPSPGSVGELEVSSPAVAMSAPVALPVRSVLMGRRRRGRNGPRTWDIWACPKNLDYRNTRNMIVSLPSSFFGFYQLFGKPSTSLSTGFWWWPTSNFLG